MYEPKNFSVQLITAGEIAAGGKGDISMVLGVKTLEIREANRNYQLDFIKLVSALLIFLVHTQYFVGPSIIALVQPCINRVASMVVRIFFVITGMLMANSISKTNINSDFGKHALSFVLKKFQKIYWPVWSAMIICLVIKLYSYPTIPGKIVNIIKAIPELLMISMAGFTNLNNAPLWYLSAMLLCMLPYVYLLYAKRDFTLWVFSPLAAVLTAGYIFQTTDGYFDISGFNGIFMNELIRTVFGLSLGVCAYIICLLIEKANDKVKASLTLIEGGLYTLIIGAVIFTDDHYALMSISFLLPVAIAITFSGKSYICKLFQFRWMKCFVPLSLYIYAYQWVGVLIVLTYFPNRDWGASVMLVACFTGLAAVLAWTIPHFGKKLWRIRS